MSRDTRRWTACVCVRNAEGWTKKVWQQKSTLSPKLFLDLSSLCSAFSSTLSFATKAMWRRTAAYLVGCRSSSPRSSSVAGFRCPIFALNLKHLIYTHQKFLSNARPTPWWTGIPCHDGTTPGRVWFCMNTGAKLKGMCLTKSTDPPAGIKQQMDDGQENAVKSHLRKVEAGR